VVYRAAVRGADSRAVLSRLGVVLKRTHSYSSLKLWRTCPAQYRAKYMDGIKSAPGPALVKGKEYHERLEAAVGTGAVPAGMWTPDGLIPALHRAGARPEQQYGMYEDGTPCSFDDPKAWLRGAIDVELRSDSRAILLDWKTGQYRVDPFQADVYATLLRSLKKDLTVEFTFVYIDAKRTCKVRPDHQAEARVRAIATACENDEVHAPRPCWACRFCPVTSCIYNGD